MDKINKKCRKFKQFPAFFGRGDGIWTHDLRVPNATRYASIFQFFIYFRKWSNMWSSHLFRTFCRKVYRLNCQCCQGVQRFEKNYQEKPLWVSRTRCATNYVMDRMFVDSYRNAYIIPNAYWKVKPFSVGYESIFLIL